MKLRFFCPSGHALTADAATSGRVVRCARCRLAVIVPQPAQIRYAHAQRAGGRRHLPANRHRPVWTGQAASHQRTTDGPSADHRHWESDGWASRPTAVRSIDADRRQVLSLHPEPKASVGQTDAAERADIVAREHGRSSEGARSSEGNMPLIFTRGRRPPTSLHRMADKRRKQLKHLAAILGGLTFFSLLPLIVAGHLNPATAPLYARWALFVAVIQFTYLAWSLIVPDWAAAWVLMIVFAVAAACYGAATALAVATPPDRAVALEMTDVRHFARGWCACVLLTNSLGAYLAGRLATLWRRETTEYFASKPPT